MKLYRLERSQTIPAGEEQVWNFFADPANLQQITPAWLHFSVRTPLPPIIHSGLIIGYSLRLYGMPCDWTTEITHVRRLSFFVDEQRFGPYRFWHHQHHFSPTSDGVLMTDLIHYALPFSLAGRMLHALFIGSALDRIFTYRAAAVSALFSSASSG